MIKTLKTITICTNCNKMAKILKMRISTKKKKNIYLLKFKAMNSTVMACVKSLHKLMRILSKIIETEYFKMLYI